MSGYNTVVQEHVTRMLRAAGRGRCPQSPFLTTGSVVSLFFAGRAGSIR